MKRSLGCAIHGSTTGLECSSLIPIPEIWPIVDTG